MKIIGWKHYICEHIKLVRLLKLDDPAKKNKRNENRQMEAIINVNRSTPSKTSETVGTGQIGK